jgi:RHS repeat-associated protein
VDYDAWGNVLDLADPNCSVGGTALCVQPFGFAGGLWEPATGVVRFGARDYDPVAGRWQQKDTIRFQGGLWSLYEYAGDEPVSSIDQGGLDACSDCYTTFQDAVAACNARYPGTTPGWGTCFVDAQTAYAACRQRNCPPPPPPPPPPPIRGVHPRGVYRPLLYVA